MNTPTASTTLAQADVSREELHTRNIEMRGFRRSDGLYEVEGRVTDSKPKDFTHPNGGRKVPAGQSIHEMGVRLVFDEDMVVHDVETFTSAAPYGDCREGGRSLQSLKGLRMTSGWSREARSRLGAANTCTHLRELLVPMATAAFQALAALRMSKPDRLDASGRPVKIDSCYAYAAEREVVMRRWPQFHRPRPPEQ